MSEELDRMRRLLARSMDQCQRVSMWWLEAERELAELRGEHIELLKRTTKPSTPACASCNDTRMVWGGFDCPWCPEVGDG